MKKLLILYIVLVGTCQAQTWFKVAVESSTTAVTLPAGAVYRLGSGTCWSANTTVTVSTKLTVYWPSGSFSFVDPCPGVAKELDVLETASAQTITAVVAGKSSSITVPSLPKPPPATTSYSFACTGTITGTVTLSSTGAATLAASTITLAAPCNGVKP